MKSILILTNQFTTSRPDDIDTAAMVTCCQQGLIAAGFAVTVANIENKVDKIGSILEKIRPDAVFNLVESVDECDHRAYLAPLALDNLSMPYTGNSANTLMALANKFLAKAHLTAASIPTSLCFSPADLSQYAPAMHFIVKSATEHASYGMTADCVVTDPSQVSAKILQQQKEYGGDWFAEQFIIGREMCVGLVGQQHAPLCLPAYEIVFQPTDKEGYQIIDYASKWDPEQASLATVRFFNPGESVALQQQLQTLARRCWDLFNMNGYARIDFRVDATGQPWVMDINANPDLGLETGFVRGAALLGLQPPQLLAKLVDAAYRQV